MSGAPSSLRQSVNRTQYNATKRSRICRSLKRIGPILLGVFGILCIFALCLQFGLMIGQYIGKSMEDQNEEVKAIPFFEAQFSKLLPRRRMLGRTRRSDEED